MHLVWMAIVGFVVGVLARWVLPGAQSMGIIMTALLGIAGSFLAGWVGAQVGWYAPGAPVGFIASLLGAVVLLFVVGKLKGAA
ncbi:MAG: GlsB/YeaQ/YmgE family stress response membrane protein [Burkholderiales bacterium]|jgi:uncharacterized membrane protein YeaQ/YmgE (transglycosylase-associated protein family)|nr:GlsB/YeaQ/YmgE family stress response membrane protein [Burkholderiales bacterium]MBP6250585.1 GlsB/YeaQ/YmgE family stress response membrane protein [Leptothrix sp. (in: b-proteobacteria)]MBP7519828.1 GlsB/YeaQ/YmgE family stress response membrane protein [Leptothrix sp. (in: b-proteobacteria)]HQY07861.1 GlsB/YeaQ/YmgE family stress response membrane protein [Burkholderiaceae bacterium]